MAGSATVIDTATAITSDQNTIGFPHAGGHSSASFLLDVTAITRTTGSLAVTIQWVSDVGGASTITVASLGSITTTGFVRLPLAANFSATRMAIPQPTRVLWDLVGDATAVTGKLYAIYGD